MAATDAWDLGGGAIARRGLFRREEGVFTLHLVAGVLAKAEANLTLGLASTGKDVQGRTISKGSRGEVTGLAAQATGAITLLIGLVLAALGQFPPPRFRPP